MLFRLLIVIGLILSACSSIVPEKRQLSHVNNNFVPTGLKIAAILKEIKIKNEPHIYNSSLLEYDSGYIMAYRKDKHFATSQQNAYVGLVSLDETFTPILEATLLNLRSDNPYEKNVASQTEDPRLFSFKKDIYLVYNDALNGKVNGKREMFLAKIDQKDFTEIQSIQKLINSDFTNRHQKNWVPFVYEDNIYFIYTTSPYVVLKLEPGNEILERISDIKIDFPWKYGEIRGGTPASFCKEYDAYVTFFHSTIIIKGNHYYFMGAYLFAKNPPFAPLAIVSKPIVFEGLYTTAPVNNKHVIFPAGLVEKGDYFIVSAGINDQASYLLVISKKDLIANMIYI